MGYSGRVAALRAWAQQHGRSDLLEAVPECTMPTILAWATFWRELKAFELQGARPAAATTSTPTVYFRELLAQNMPYPAGTASALDADARPDRSDNAPALDDATPPKRPRVTGGTQLEHSTSREAIVLQVRSAAQVDASEVGAQTLVAAPARPASNRPMPEAVLMDDAGSGTDLCASDTEGEEEQFEQADAGSGTDLCALDTEGEEEQFEQANWAAMPFEELISRVVSPDVWFAAPRGSDGTPFLGTPNTEADEMDADADKLGSVALVAQQMASGSWGLPHSS